MNVETFFHEDTNTFTHLAWDGESGEAAIIDPVLDYDPASGRTATDSAEKVAAFAEGRGLKVKYILETHAHADHLSAAQYLKRRFGAALCIGHRIREVQNTFAGIYNLDAGKIIAEADFDRLLKEGDEFALGALRFRVIETPGHTPACVTYAVDGAAFVGDTLFMPDAGTARCDFPGGDAASLYRSIQKILALPAGTTIYLCHDYGADGARAIACKTSVGEQKKSNIHVGGGKTEAEYVKMRTERDRTLGAPRLLLPSLQVNIRAGKLPPPEGNGTAYLKIPLNRF